MDAAKGTFAREFEQSDPSAGAMTPTEAEVYREVARDLSQMHEMESEPSAEEFEGAAKLYALCGRLQRAAAARAEIKDPDLLPHLEHGLIRLGEQRRDAEASGLDESDAVASIVRLLAACDALIARLRAYKPVPCNCCGKRAAHRAITDGQPYCLRCATYMFTHDLGESYAAGKLIEKFTETMHDVGVDADELIAAITAATRDEEPRVGATAAHFRALRRERADGLEGICEIDGWQRMLTPIDESAAWAQAQEGEQR